MSKLGSVTGELNRERRLLRDLNNALLVVQATSLGKAEYFGYSKTDVENSREMLRKFVGRLRDVLVSKKPSSELQPIVSRLRSGMKPVADWVEDLGQLEGNLAPPNREDEEGLTVLEDVLSLLDTDFAEDLRRLYVS